MTFAHPAFLWGLTALAIPIIVHLFNFRRYRTLYFSNTRFLKELNEDTKRQSQIRKWIILLIRIAAILCLVMAFAQPRFRQNAGNISRGNAYVQIYIDNSFSMENTAEQGSLLHEAKEKAEGIVDACGESSLFLLLTDDLQGKHAQYLNAEEVKAEIRQIETTPFTRKMEEIIRYGNRLFENVPSGNHQRYLISDFQKSICQPETWTDDSSCQTWLVPMLPHRTDNFYIDSVWMDAPVFLCGQEIRLHAMLRNEGKDDVDKLPIRLWINGKQTAIASVDIKAGEGAVADIPFTLMTEGLQEGYLEITDEPITYDDVLYLSFNVKRKFTVTYLGKGGSNPYLDALFEDDSSIAYQKTDLLHMDLGLLRNSSLLLLDQPENMGSGLLQAIHQFVEEGGSLLLVPSTQPEKALDKTIANELGISVFTGLDTQKNRISDILFTHALYQNTFERTSERMQLPVIHRHYKVSSSPLPGKEVLLTMENQDEFLSVQTLGKGCIYILSVPLDASFSDFPKHALFVPTVFNMVLTGHNSPNPYHLIGSRLPIALDPDRIPNDKTLTLQEKKNDFSCIPEIRYRLGSCDMFVHDQVKDAGNYLLTDGTDSLQFVSFNYDRTESRTECWSLGDLKKFVSGHSDLQLLNLQNRPNAAISELIQGKDDQSGIFLWLALVLLLTECVLLRLWKE